LKKDWLNRYSLEGKPIRGGIICLESAWQEALVRIEKDDKLPYLVKTMLGELTAAAILLRSQIKLEGELSLQLNGGGALRFAVVEVGVEYNFRVALGLDRSLLTQRVVLEDLVNREGRLAVTLKGGKGSNFSTPYQGIISLTDADFRNLSFLSSLIEHYMKESEQIRTRVKLEANSLQIGGLLVQSMPDGTMPDYPTFDEARLVDLSLDRGGLLDQDPQSILTRLYPDTTVRMYPSSTPFYECKCSEERVEQMLVALGAEELKTLRVEREGAEITCEFCNRVYLYGGEELERLIALSVLTKDQSRAH
jgi:molecular chaperone Hsp33